jgi:hypothetical protein
MRHLPMGGALLPLRNIIQIDKLKITQATLHINNKNIIIIITIILIINNNNNNNNSSSII